ncbi:MAG: LamG domain-containing protein [Patescibacteria group bacterium]|nr:LamG domain-containing protein [Patescibacteria group bacterium]
MNARNGRSSFTLIELLIVIAILVILAVVVVLTLNPSELMAQGRDSQRLSDMASINSAVNIYLVDSGGTGFLGTSSVVYVSLPDTASSTCEDLSLPALPSGYTYNCVSTTSLVKTDGTGWLPVRLASTSSGTPLGSLPKDPTNSTSSGLYYTYITDGNGNFELTAVLESIKYASQEASDGGPVNFMYEIGNKLTLSTMTRVIVGVWKFDGNGNDGSANANNFTLSGSPLPSFANGVLGQAYAFSNSGTGYLYATSNASTTPLGASPRTMGIWVYPTSTPNSSNGEYVLIGYGSASTNQMFVLTDIGIGLTYGAADLAVYSNDMVTTQAIPLNKWSFLVGVYDGNGNIYLYYNGQLISSKAVTLNTTVAIPLEVGGSPEFSGLLSDYMDGYLDEPFITDYAMTASQIQNIYNAEKPH